MGRPYTRSNLVLVIVHPYQEMKSYSCFFFPLGLDMAIALDIAMSMAMTYASSLL